MKTKLTTLALVSLLGLAGSTVALAVDVAASAPPEAVATAQMRIDQTVYTQRLPAVAELTSPAATQGRTVERIEQSATQITVSYKSANGQITTVAYALLPGSGGAPAPATVAVPGSPAPTVIYATEPRVVYYSDAPYYYGYPRYYYPPVSIGIGLGFRGGYHGGYYRGGFGFHHH